MRSMPAKRHDQVIGSQMPVSAALASSPWQTITAKRTRQVQYQIDPVGDDRRIDERIGDERQARHRCSLIIQG